MGYRRLDINLLPPELQPGPVVRYAVVINTILIGLTVAFLVVDSFLGLTQMASLRRDIVDKEDQIRSKATVIADYNQLTDIQDHVDSIGRLINLASAEYVDMPVIMDRLTRLLPDGVYLDTVTSEIRTVGSIDSRLRIILAASKPDPALLVRTFDAFKADDILGDCYMRSAEFKEREISQVLEAAGITWKATGPDLPDFSNTKQYTFEIQSIVHPPISAGNLVTMVDKSEFFKVAEPEENDAAASEPAAGASRAGGTPEGVSVVEAN